MRNDGSEGSDAKGRVPVYIDPQTYALRIWNRTMVRTRAKKLQETTTKASPQEPAMKKRRQELFENSDDDDDSSASEEDDDDEDDEDEDDQDEDDQEEVEEGEEKKRKYTKRDPDEDEIKVSFPMDETYFADWKSFQDFLTAYERKTCTKISIANTDSVEIRNKKMKTWKAVLNGSTVPDFVPEECRVWRRKYICTHGWSERYELSFLLLLFGLWMNTGKKYAELCPDACAFTENAALASALDEICDRQVAPLRLRRSMCGSLVIVRG